MRPCYHSDHCIQSPEKGKTLRLLILFIWLSSFYKIEIRIFFELFPLFLLEYWAVSINVVIYSVAMFAGRKQHTDKILTCTQNFGQFLNNKWIVKFISKFSIKLLIPPQNDVNKQNLPLAHSRGALQKTSVSYFFLTLIVLCYISILSWDMWQKPLRLHDCDQFIKGAYDYISPDLLIANLASSPIKYWLYYMFINVLIKKYNQFRSFPSQSGHLWIN